MILQVFRRPGALFFIVCVLASLFIGKFGSPTWSLERISLDVQTDDESRLYFLEEGAPHYIKGKDLIAMDKAILTPENIAAMNAERVTPEVKQEYTYQPVTIDGKTETLYYLTTARRHWGPWSLLPAVVALSLCWITKEPIISLFSGIICAAFILGKYDITEAVLVPELSTKSAAGVIVLYLWLLGGLM